MNNSAINLILGFAVGSTAGAVIAWKYAKETYEKRADEEISSMRDYYKKMVKGVQDGTVLPNMDVASLYPKQSKLPNIPTEVDMYKDFVNKLYGAQSASDSEESKPEEKKEEKVTMNENKPYVIPPEEFGETGYETRSLTYYDDDVLTDDEDNRIDDIEGTVGEDFADHFGEYEDDSVFIRNDELEIDYEILLTAKRFADL